MILVFVLRVETLNPFQPERACGSWMLYPPSFRFHGSSIVHSECVFGNLEDILCKVGNKEMPLANIWVVSWEKCSIDPQVVCPYRTSWIFEYLSSLLRNLFIKRVESLDEHLTGKVYNIENDVIHYWHKKCITSKTMLYTIATKSV